MVYQAQAACVPFETKAYSTPAFTDRHDFYLFLHFSTSLDFYHGQIPSSLHKLGFHQGLRRTLRGGLGRALIFVQVLRQSGCFDESWLAASKRTNNLVVLTPNT